MTDYLEEGAAVLREALESAEARYNAIPSIRKAEDRRELLEARVRVVEGFAALAAAGRSPQPEQAILPHEAEMRIGDALNLAGTFGTTDGGHHKMWVIDQMARMLTGCPTVQKTGTDANGAEYTYDALGESGEYLRFTREAGDWDEGTAP